MTNIQLKGIEILEEIGRGNYGSVYKAYTNKLSKHVAVKVMPAMISKNPAMLERFKREARVLMEMEHDNIIKALDLGQDGDLYYLIFDWIDGYTMDHEINTRQTLPCEDIFIEVFQSCARGLAYAHESGIVHRDLTPENIFFTLDNEIKIIDFGFAKVLGEETISAAGEILGSAPYMSPEQYGDSSTVTHASDIYSLGAVGYRYATDRYPYDSDNPMTIIKRMSDTEFQIMPPIAYNRNISIKTDSIIRKCLEKDVSKRYKSVEGLLTDIRLGDQDEPVAGYTRASFPTTSMRQDDISYNWFELLQKKYRPQRWAALIVAILIFYLILYIMVVR